MQFPKIILMLSSKQAWFLYFLLKVVPGQTAQALRKNLGNLLEAMKLPPGK
ncbi:MAG TPA: hypothetical protein VEC96_16505 [Anaerolineae bacterium]|jgi:hypothetical protein|nr:hypothetical protein [Anaerolineae bacterium]